MTVKISKNKTVFRCESCAYTSSKWLGKCPDCGNWNTLTEEKVFSESSFARRNLTDFTSSVSLLSEVSTLEFNRTSSGIAEFDRIVGGGLVPGNLILLGGAPGIGKSTLVLEIASNLGKNKKVLYVSGEESQEQVKSRADRLAIHSPNLYLLSETNLENILENVRKMAPDFLIIDSIQTTYLNDFSSLPGSVGQIRECSAEFLRCAKAMRITVFLLGHVTKEGDFAGPKILEHMVDTVLYFENEPQQSYRILRVYKNRFGPTSEIALFEMKETGLKEVPNLSQVFLSERHNAPGSVIIATMEGSRPLLLEIQALVSRTHFGIPRRMVTSLDFNRALLMMAVLEKRLSYHLETQDVFLNVTGGAKVKEPAGDLGVACAIASAYGNFISSNGLLIGEVGLGGEVRSVPRIEDRLNEAERLGLNWAVIPKANLKEKIHSHKIKIVPVETLEEAVRWIKSKEAHSL